jgi:hypothetical protein
MLVDVSDKRRPNRDRRGSPRRLSGVDNVSGTVNVDN